MRAVNSGAQKARIGRTPAMVLVGGALAAVNVIGRFGPRHAMLVAGPAIAGALLLVARGAGLTPDQVGLDPRYWRRGIGYAAAAAGLTGAVYPLAVSVPGTRSMFIDERYRLDPAHAMFTAAVAVPLGTVVFEEVAFRGMLWGLIRRDRGAVTATVVSSALFGLWHIGPALQLGQANRAVGDVIGRDPLAQVLTVGGVAVFTALAGAVLCELRRRSGSLLAPVGLHWAANGLGVLVSAGSPGGSSR